MAKKKEEEEELKDQIPSLETLIKEGEDYGLDTEGKRFYKHQERWYLVDKDDNVKRIK
jgi:uncharacterized protein YchJ